MEVTELKEKNFTLNEICDNSMELFGVYPEVIYGAIKYLEKDKYSITEMKDLIAQYTCMEVK